MNYIIEGVYNLLESSITMIFISMYFKSKSRLSEKLDLIITIAVMFLLETVVRILDPHWLIVLAVSVLVVFGIVTFFYNGSLSERAVIAFISIFLLALSDVCALTSISWLMEVDYNELVENSGFSRLLAVLSSKALYLIAISLILFFKRKYRLFLNKLELILISVTLILSGVQVALIRNIINTTKSYYNIFLVIILCVVVMNIIIYYTMLYIGKKNIDEKNYSLMQKQLEFQEESIQNLERKYDETAKIRHDIKNYISCALVMAEKGDYEELTEYLEELSEEKINAITSYVATKRKVMGAVLNSKLSKAKNSDIDMQFYILSELENVSDMDIGIMFANLLDNAIEACEKNNSPSDILLKTWTEAGYYFIEVSNTVENDVLSDNPKLKTSKKNGDLHGVGLRSVRDIVKKYDGIIGFDQKGSIFRVCLSLARE